MSRVGAAHRAPHSWTEHVRLVEAIAAGDSTGAETAATAHGAAAAAGALPAGEENGAAGRSAR